MPYFYAILISAQVPKLNAVVQNQKAQNIQRQLPLASRPLHVNHEKLIIKSVSLSGIHGEKNEALSTQSKEMEPV